MFRTRLLLVSLVIGLGAIPVTAGATTSAPTCIVSLSPSATQILYAIGAGSSVRAVDKDATYPTHGLPHTRIDALNPNVESIAGMCPAGTGVTHNPDLVVISYNANSIKENLTALHVPVVEQDAPATLSAAYAQIRTLGKLTDHRHGAQRLITRIKSALREGIEATQGKGQKLSAYIELDPTLYSVTSSTFLGSIFAKFGVHNIADPESTSADAGYPQLSQEYIITANPTLIVLADTVCCNASAQTIAARPGWTKIAAVKNNNVLALNDTVASTWGSLLPRLIREISHAIIRGSAK